MRDNPDISVTRLMAGDRRALAKAITLIESTRPADRAAAAELLASLDPPDPPALRVGLSGTPGVGKSSFIEALGLDLISQGHRVAVLAVDPSSARTGGAILGDKTRMERLSRAPHAFIRPSPAAGELGGVARHTRETVALVEAAGFDIVLVETVGVGQSETAVADMTDVFVLLLAPAGGDELQGVKRGIMERADLVLVNKADGALKAPAEATRADYAGALALLRPRPGDAAPQARTVSALTGAGLRDAWTAIADLASARRASGAFGATRAAQAQIWFRAEVDHRLRQRIAGDPVLLALRADLDRLVASGALSPAAAADRLLTALFATP
ncbi:MAG: methylmalonyl Co-A mutase-associated GTPase MeaB [Pseudomonadota bacterium]